MPRHTPRHRKGRAYAATVGLTLTAALAGCGSSSTIELDNTSVERAIADSILSEHHIYTLVKCPVEPQRKGVKFTCEAKLEVGNYPITVTETNNSGHVSYANSAPLQLLVPAKVQGAIKATLAERGLRARVSCPSDVLQKKGLIFWCTAKVGATSTPFEVTEADDQGHVTYIGR